jgi:hypothetical protein
VAATILSLCRSAARPGSPPRFHRQPSWFFDIVCVDRGDRVIETIGMLMVEVMTAPAAQLTIRHTGLEPLAPASGDETRSARPPVRQGFRQAR